MHTSHKGTPPAKVVENRELSWLQFNQRVQSEADNLDNPLLERAKFLAIVTSNLDEFVQVRYLRLAEAAKRAYYGQSLPKAKGGLDVQKLYRKVTKGILKQNDQQYLLYHSIRSELFGHNICVYPVYSLTEEHRRREKEIFIEEIEPYLKSYRLHGYLPHQKQLHLCVKLLWGKNKQVRYMVVPLPTNIPRLFDVSSGREMSHFIRTEDIAKHYVHRLFPKAEVEHVAAFRLLCNQNFLVEEQTAEDVLPAVREMIAKRISGQAVRLEVEARMSQEMLTLLMEVYQVAEEQSYRATGPLDLNKLMFGLYGILKRPELKFPSAKPIVKEELMGEDIFERIDEKDHLLYHPYHSFAPVVNLMQRAAVDPTVTTIKQTLYRVSSNSPIVAALMEAARNGKQVTVLFEAHARFDEENNLHWGEKLTRAGCSVHYGLPMKKVHSKITFFERVVDGEVKRSVHLGTGNYHDGTAKLYTDFGLLTADEQLTTDAVAIFDRLEGKEDAPIVEILKAPESLQTGIIALIEREIAHAQEGKEAHILAKMNSLSEGAVMEALVRASMAGVKVDLIVRGVCCLTPQVEGISENIHIRSLVGRQLEHARAFRFENAGESEVYLSSADWMPRNLHRRVELMFPVKDPICKQSVENVLTLQMRDTEKAFIKQADTAYERISLPQELINAQEVLIGDVEAVFAGTYPAFAKHQEGQ